MQISDRDEQEPQSYESSESILHQVHVTLS